MSKYTPTTNQVRTAWGCIKVPRPPGYFPGYGAHGTPDEFDRWLDRVKAEARESVVTPEAREHWEWTQKGRQAHGDRGCVCTLCGVMERVYEKGESNE